MKTAVLRLESQLDTAAAALAQGGLVAVPTETVYGLCCNGLDEAAVQRLYEAKGRPETKPLSLMVPGAEALARYARAVPPAARLLAEEFWPGPLTLVLPARDFIPALTLAGGDTVGLRCPAHPLTLALLRRCALPLAGPSANPSGKPSPKTAGEVLEYFDGQIEAVVDGGECTVGTESTILNLSATPYRILRQGALSIERIVQTLRRGMTVVGITGGSGGGKTTLLRYLERQGALALDCDEIYHRLTESSDALRAALTERFGEVYAHGKLRRKALGERVWNDPQALRDLNAITHGFVKAEVLRLLDEHAMAGGRLAAIDAIALFESGLAGECSTTVGVLAHEEARVARLMAREGIGEDYARARLAAQQPESFFRGRCDYLLENNGSAAELEAACQQLYENITKEKA